MTQQAKAAPVAGSPRRRPARVPTPPALGSPPGAGKGGRFAPLDLRGLIPDPDMLHACSIAERLRRRRAAIEALIERAIEALDALDGDCDLEAEDDCCAAADDDLSSAPCRLNNNDHRPGTPEDAEPDDEDSGAGEDEGLPMLRQGWRQDPAKHLQEHARAADVWVFVA